MLNIDLNIVFVWLLFHYHILCLESMVSVSCHVGYSITGVNAMLLKMAGP